MAGKDFEKDQTICWGCANACNNGCSWSRGLVPVEGWTVKEVHPGISVMSCPQYKKDDRKNSRPNDFDNDGCLELLKAIGRTMYKDYIEGEGRYKSGCPEEKNDTIVKNRKDTEHFLTSKYGRTLMMLTDPESTIQELRLMAEIHDESEGIS